MAQGSTAAQYVRRLYVFVVGLTTAFFSTSAFAACPSVSVISGTYNLSPGDTCTHLKPLNAGTGGTINAPSVTITGSAPASGYSVFAHDGGQINFSDSSKVNVTLGTTMTAIAASGSGSKIDARNATQITVGNNGNAILMWNDGQVLLNNSTLINVNSTGYGIVIDNTTTNLTGVGITINGYSATSFGNGMQLRNSGNVAIFDSLNITGLSSSTGSGAFQGIFVQSNSKVAVDPGATVNIKLSNARGSNVYGVNATTGGQVLGGHFNISIPNGNGIGFRSVNPGSFINATNSHVELGPTTVNAQAVDMLSGGLVKLDDTTTIHSVGTAAAGLDNIGILIEGTAVPDGTVGSGVTLTMDGTNGIGVLAAVNRALSATSTPSSISIDNLTVTGSGTRIGLTTSSGSSLTATNSTVIVNANNRTNAAALLVRGDQVTNTNPTWIGGTINFINSTAQLLGPAGTTAGGIRVLFSDTPSVVNLNNSSVTTEQSPGITSLGGLVNINLMNGSRVIGGGGLLVQSITDGSDPSVVNLTTDSGSMSGNAFADAVSTLNMTLSGNSLWTGAALNVTNVSIDPSTWVITDNSTVSQTTTNAGLIQYAAPAGDPTQLESYKTLTTHDYVGNGGTIALNAFLSGNGAPSDKLVIDGGTATGSTVLDINRVAGSGTYTSGSGIQIVQANNATIAPGSFGLSHPVVAGPYQYALYRGEYALHLGSPDITQSASWFLRSEIIGLSGPEPFYSGEVSLYSAIPSMGLLYGRMILSTLQQRVGDEALLRCRPQCHCFANGAWARIINEGGNRHDGGVLQNGPIFNYHFLALQTGFELYRQKHRNGSRDHAGVFLVSGDGSGNVQRLYDLTELQEQLNENDVVLGGTGSNAGRDEFNAFTLGGYFTHFGANGWYIDGVLIGNYYDVNTVSQHVKPLTTQGYSLGASLEVGYPFKYHSFALEPEVQMAYQNLKLSKGADEAADVSFGRTNSLLGSVGVRLANTWNLNDRRNAKNRRKITAWARIRELKEYHANSKTSFLSEDGAVTFHSNMHGTFVVGDIGGTAELNDQISAYVGLGRTVFLYGHGHAYNATTGLRVNLI